MFTKEKTITVTVDDYIEKDAVYHAEFTDKNGNPCLVQVVPDDCSENPREAYDQLWTWVTSRGAGYSDKKDDVPENYEGEDGKLDKEFLKHNFVVPLYLYRHSGDRISTGSFYGLLPQGHAEFDSGCMGLAYLSKEKAISERGGEYVDVDGERVWRPRYTHMSKRIAVWAKGVLESEVREMNAWLSGSVYGIKITNLETEKEDAVWEFICSDRDNLLCVVMDMLSGWTDNAREIVDRLEE